MQVHYYPKRRPCSVIKEKKPAMTLSEYQALKAANGILLLKKKAYYVTHVFTGIVPTKKKKEKFVIHVVLQKKP